MFIVLSVVLISLMLIVVLFINLSPQFGGSPSAEQKKEYAKSPNYRENTFHNIADVKLGMSASDMMKASWGWITNIPNAVPAKPLPVDYIDSTDLIPNSIEPRFVWFGHSAILMQLEGYNILVDPMLGSAPSPVPFIGTSRFSEDLPIEIEELPDIDIVLISHDHYDHLDYESIKRLKEKVSRFYVPLGLGNHLRRWGVPDENIKELDWWDDVEYEKLKFTSTPSQHFSGRGIMNRNSTLWCSWVIQSDNHRIYFSGDSGYAPHFKKIGDKYGPFDFAMIECGQYNELWPSVHMFPEQTAQAGIDLKASKIMPIHWGAFKLAQHTWTDPVERVSKKAKELDIDILTPRIGEIFSLNHSDIPQGKWW